MMANNYKNLTSYMANNYKNLTDYKNLSGFFHKFKIQLLDTNKRVPSIRYPLNIENIKDLTEISYDTETLYTVEIPESALIFLSELEENFFRYAGNGAQLAQELIVSHNEEARAIKNNPELKELRAQYDTYLRLVAKSPGNLKSFTNQ